ENGKVLHNKPYLHDSIKSVISHFFRDTRSIGSRNLSRFKTSFPDDPNCQEPEATIPLVAFATAMIHAALLCWQSGTYHHIKFSADDHFNAYTHHVRILETIRQRKPKAFHKLMAELLSDAIHGAQRDTTTNDEATIATVDFDAMED
ncbi:hypothetical protein BDN72DRAFT_865865, partial [Pluteus cervinus]